MSLANEMSAADVAAVMGNNGGFNGGDGAWWLIVLFLFAFNGGWGNGGNGGGYAMQSGFDQAALMAGINGINASLGAAEVSRANLAASLASQMSTLAMAQQSCCCENRLATSQLTGTVQTEAAANRFEVANNTRDIIANQTANNQAILDKLCQLELDNIKQNYENRIAGMQAQNAQLQAELTAARFAASQGAQTAQIIANNEAQTVALERYLAPVPQPAYIVQNPSCACGNSYGCGFVA